MLFYLFSFGLGSSQWIPLGSWNILCKRYTAASNRELSVTEDNLRKAISIAPFDVYYLGLVDVDLARLQAANASTYKEEVVKLVANMTQNVQAVFTYDPSNNFTVALSLQIFTRWLV